MKQIMMGAFLVLFLTMASQSSGRLVAAPKRRVLPETGGTMLKEDEFYRSLAGSLSYSMPDPPCRRAATTDKAGKANMAKAARRLICNDTSTDDDFSDDGSDFPSASPSNAGADVEDDDVADDDVPSNDPPLGGGDRANDDIPGGVVNPGTDDDAHSELTNEDYNSPFDT